MKYINTRVSRSSFDSLNISSIHFHQLGKFFLSKIA